MTPYEMFRHHLFNQDKWELIGIPLGAISILLGIALMIFVPLFLLLVVASSTWVTYSYLRREEAKKQKIAAMQRFFASEPTI